MTVSGTLWPNPNTASVYSEGLWKAANLSLNTSSPPPHFLLDTQDVVHKAVTFSSINTSSLPPKINSRGKCGNLGVVNKLSFRNPNSYHTLIQTVCQIMSNFKTAGQALQLY